jgi:hypothetical protein
MGFSLGIGVRPYPAAGVPWCARNACDGVAGSLHARSGPHVPTRSPVNPSNYPPAGNILRVTAQGYPNGDVAARVPVTRLTMRLVMLSPSKEGETLWERS